MRFTHRGPILPSQKAIQIVNFYYHAFYSKYIAICEGVEKDFQQNTLPSRIGYGTTKILNIYNNVSIMSCSINVNF